VLGLKNQINYLFIIYLFIYSLLLFNYYLFLILIYLKSFSKVFCLEEIQRCAHKTVIRRLDAPLAVEQVTILDGNCVDGQNKWKMQRKKAIIKILVVWIFSIKFTNWKLNMVINYCLRLKLENEGNLYIIEFIFLFCSFLFAHFLVQVYL
jgi:hypothetical protein